MGIRGRLFNKEAEAKALDGSAGLAQGAGDSLFELGSGHSWLSWSGWKVFEE